ncbi:hypothetical protein [Streptomyces sp. NPDC088258]|uniref:hypothetical protein n=1 Tax=Streptomyces sp. NPDC088258 TaxID=3365849 RepID=UPI003804983F
MAKEPKRPEIPDHLVALQRASDAAHREVTQEPYTPEGWQPWLTAADAVQQAVTEYAAAAEKVTRPEAEAEVKRLARLADEAS